MKSKSIDIMVFIGMILGLIALCFLLSRAEDSTKVRGLLPDTYEPRKIKGEIKTVFDANGRPVNQSQTAKGFHRVTGTLKLVAGRGTISLNTRTVEGRQDVSFISRGTYKGSVTLTDTTNTKTYTVYPRTGRMAIIVSSDTTDTATVGYTLEGE